MPSSEVLLWTKLVELASLEVNQLDDYLLAVDNYREPLREQLCQFYMHSAPQADIFYLEVTIKTYSNFVTNVKSSFPSISTSEVQGKELTFSIKAFSLARKTWIKDYQPLTEVVRLLQRDALLHPDIKNYYYSMLRNASILLAHKIILQENE